MVSKIDTKRLNAINALEDIIIATRHGNTVVKKGDKLAGIRVVPLAIQQARLDLKSTSIYPLKAT